MEADDLQRAWQSPTSHRRVTIDAELLLNEVRRNQRAFAAAIFCRDVREIGIALVLIPVWILMGWGFNLPWTWYLTMPVIVGVAGFFFFERLRHREPLAADQPLRQHVEASLAEVEHQIWLLRNVFWWYILPFLPPAFTFLLHATWLASDNIGWDAYLVLVFAAAIVIATDAFIYWLNQRAVRTGLEPRREELKALLKSLKNGA